MASRKYSRRRGGKLKSVLKNKLAKLIQLKQWHELRLKHLIDEKHQAIEKVNKLQTKISHHQQHLLDHW